MFVLIMLFVWRFHWTVSVLYILFYGTIDGAYFTSTFQKTLKGAWLPLGIAIVLAIVMNVWRYGSILKSRRIAQKQMMLLDLLETYTDGGGPRSSSNVETAPLRAHVDSKATVVPESANRNLASLNIAIEHIRFVDTKEPVSRTDGMALFYAEGAEYVPRAFRHFLSRFGTAPRYAVFVYQDNAKFAHVDPADRVRVEQLRLPGFYRVVHSIGYADPLAKGNEFAHEVMEAISNIEGTSTVPQVEIYHDGKELNSRDLSPKVTTFVIGNERVYVKEGTSIIKRFVIDGLYRAISVFNKPVKTSLPHEQVIEVGIRVVV